MKMAETKKKKTKKAEETPKKKVESREDSEPYKTVKYALSTEKGVRAMEGENKLLFVVDYNANKSDIKKSIESMFNVKVEKVNMLITPKNQKRAWVRFSEETPAIDVATELGLI